MSSNYTGTGGESFGFPDDRFTIPDFAPFAAPPISTLSPADAETLHRPFSAMTVNEPLIKSIAMTKDSLTINDKAVGEARADQSCRFKKMPEVKDKMFVLKKNDARIKSEMEPAQEKLAKAIEIHEACPPKVPIKPTLDTNLHRKQVKLMALSSKIYFKLSLLFASAEVCITSTLIYQRLDFGTGLFGVLAALAQGFALVAGSFIAAKFLLHTITKKDCHVAVVWFAWLLFGVTGLGVSFYLINLGLAAEARVIFPEGEEKVVEFHIPWVIVQLFVGWLLIGASLACYQLATDNFEDRFLHREADSFDYERSGETVEAARAEVTRLLEQEQELESILDWMNACHLQSKNVADGYVIWLQKSLRSSALESIQRRLDA